MSVGCADFAQPLGGSSTGGIVQQSGTGVPDFLSFFAFSPAGVLLAVSFMILISCLLIVVVSNDVRGFTSFPLAVRTLRPAKSPHSEAIRVKTSRVAVEFPS